MLTLLLGSFLFAEAANAACNTPTGAAGDMTYSTSANVMAYCDGTNWVSMAGGVSLTVNTSGGGADNLGDHTATQDLNMSGYSVNSGLNATFTGLGNFGSLLAGGLTVTGQASITTISTTLLQVGSGGGASCALNINGALRYNSTSSTLEICTGTSWSGLASGTITGSGVSGGSATSIAFWNGPNSLTYESNTTSGLYWDASNKRLGVGTNSPALQLDVVNNGPAYMRTMAYRDSNESGGLQLFHARGTSTAPVALHAGDKAGSFYFDGFDGGAFYNIANIAALTDSTPVSGSSLSGALVFGTTPVGSFNWVPERMRITNAGYVGIGTSTPTAVLQVSGTFIVSQTNQNSLASASLAVDSRGVSVSSIIHINGSPGAAMGAGSNQIVSGTSNVTANQDTSVTITTAGSQRMIIGANGNVGIGTNHVTAPLTVQADANSSALNIFGRSSDDKSAIVFYNNNATNPNNFGYIQAGPTYLAMATNNTERMRIDSSGNVGIGTSLPGFTLDVSGSLRMSNSSNNASVSVQYMGASGRLYQFISCKLCGSTGVGGLVVYDATAPADRAYIAAGVNGWQTPSDRRLKKDIRTLSVLDKLGPVRGVSYKLRDSGKPQIGVIAQEIDQSFPLAVTGKRDGAKFLGVSYDAIAAIALEGVKELKELFDTDHAEVAKLKAANDNLARRVEALEMEVRRMKTTLR